MSTYRAINLRDFHTHSKNRGVALIFVLALLAIVSLMLVSFVTMMRLDRAATFSYSQSLKAEQLGLGGLQIVMNELQNEMGKDGLPDLTYPSRPLYTNITSTNIMPQVRVSDKAPAALIKVSSTSPSFSGTIASGILRASDVSSATPSQNGRSVSTRRWNQAFLGEIAAGSDTPRWVMMTRSGPTNQISLTANPSPTSNSANNSKPSNPQYVIGRFAYAVYDVGGLLDIKVAGYPSKLETTNLASIKGTLAGADVSDLGIDPDALVSWRNTASSTNYTAYVTNFLSTNGIGKVYPGDTTFLSRQDLIKAAYNGTAGLTPQVLTNLTVFTRERNSPSWHPQTPTGSTNNYTALAKTVTSTNVFIPLVRHTGNHILTSYHIDGSSFTYKVEPGDPVVYRRFPLDRIKWLGPNGPQNGGTAASVQACFGLLWDTQTSVWKYVGATGSTEQSSIKTLSLVAGEKREANFFELLQAGILNGSLALSNGNPAGGAGFSFTYQSSFNLHVFRIGASIISQYDNTGYPCVIEYNQSGRPWQACGVKSLPYINFYKLLGGASPDDTVNSVANYFMLSLWNPHQGVSTFSGTRPPVRIHLKGSITLGNAYSAYPVVNLGGIITGASTCTFDTTIPLKQTQGQGVNGFSEPTVVKPSDVTTTVGASSAAGLEWASVPAIDSSGINFVGYRLPDFVLDRTLVPTVAQQNTAAWRNVNAFIGHNGAGATQPAFQICLEFQSPSGTWVPYSFLNGINESTSWSVSWLFHYTAWLGYYQFGGVPIPPVPPNFLITTTPTYATYPTLYCQPSTFMVPDPRSVRFSPLSFISVTRNYLTNSIWGPATDTYFQDNGYGGGVAAAANYTALQIVPYICSNPVNSGTGPYYPGWLCRNNGNITSIYTSYADRDGVKRIADSGRFTTAPKSNGWEGNPYARTIDRPIILNRPFNHVAELGYVSRDVPWKTLDFFTSLSADAGLLDLFTVSQNDDPVQAGRIHLNTRNEKALTAILKNTQTDPIANASIGNPSKIAESLVTFTGTSSGTALTSKEQIANKFVAGLSDNVFVNKDEQNIKARRESIVRALSDVGQTRTWNLMIDIVAQAGRYSLNAKSPEEFTVEGERRFWLHVAIDRLTGEIIDQQLEPYNN